MAEIRRRQIESGADLTFSQVFVPYYRTLVAASRPSSLLEIGCGTGHLSSILSKMVPTVVALEPSKGMFQVAEDVLKGTRARLLNCSAENYIDDIRFPMIISHMCLQAVANLDRFLKSVADHMGTASLFVFVIPHPCFYNSYKPFFAPEEFHYMREAEKTVSFTITRDPSTPISGIQYHHRPLSRYFAHLKTQGLDVTDFQEVFPSDEVQSLYGRPWDYPRYCVFHTKKA